MLYTIAIDKKESEFEIISTKLNSISVGRIPYGIMTLRLTSKLNFRTQKGTSLEVDFKVEHITRCRNCY